MNVFKKYLLVILIKQKLIFHSLEILEISLKEGEKEESIGERVGGRGLVVKPAMKSTTLGRDVTEVVKKRDQPSTLRELGEVEGWAKFLVICSERNY